MAQMKQSGCCTLFLTFFSMNKTIMTLEEVLPREGLLANYASEGPFFGV
jgi:hypothetical protein